MCHGFGCVDDDPEVLGSKVECPKCNGMGSTPQSTGLKDAAALMEERIEALALSRGLLQRIAELEAQLEQAVLAEREACAAMVDERFVGAHDIAAAIRARGKE
jgi:hypothetical protein